MKNIQNNQEYITQLCHSLFSQGKHPTVALIRSQAQRTLSIPDVVKGLQRWNQKPQANDDNVGAAVKPIPETPQSLAERVQQLESQMADISAQLKALLQNKE